jgi:hypothetical protein
MSEKELRAIAIKLANELTPDEIFRRLGIYAEAKRILEEIPELLGFIDDTMPNPPADFEERLKRYKK